jgi:hypothetical protein
MLKASVFCAALAWSLSAHAAPTSNRVRDDIVAYINALPDSPMQKQALLQEAAALELTLSVDTANQPSLLEAGEKMMKSSHCLFQRYGTLAAAQRSRELERRTTNTEARANAYERFNTAMSGTTLKSVFLDRDCEN